MARFSVPFQEALANHNGWARSSSDERLFSVIRFHFDTKAHRPTPAEIGYGDSFYTVTSPRGTEVQQKITESYEVTRINVDRTLQSHFSQSAVLSSISAEVSSKIGVGPFGVALKFGEMERSELTSKIFSEACGQNFETYSATKTVETTISIPLDQDAKYYVVPEYRIKIMDVSLVYIDYLVVGYKRPFLGKGKRFKKPVSAVPPRNEMRIEKPIFSVRFWDLLGNEVMVDDSNLVGSADPAELEIGPPGNPQRRPIFSRAGPSLYDLSEKAFVRKWRPELAPQCHK